MCDPVSIGLSVGAATMASQAAAQSSAARSQNKYRDSLGKAEDAKYSQTIESVNKDVGLQTDALMAQRIQQIDAQKQELQNITRDARNNSATFSTASAEAGVTGRSVDVVHQQFERDVMEFSSAASRNLTMYTAQLNREVQAIYSRGQSIINQGYPSPLPPPAQVNYGLIAVNAATAGLNAGLMANSAFGTPKVGTTGTGAPN